MSKTNKEIARHIGNQMRAYRRSAGITQLELAQMSGIGLTPLKRFESTGGTTLNNLIAIFRGLGLLSRIIELPPSPQGPSPLELLRASKTKSNG